MACDAMFPACSCSISTILPAVDLQPDCGQRVSTLHLEPRLQRDLTGDRIGDVDLEGRGLGPRPPQCTFTDVHLSGVLRHPDVGRQGRHGFRVAREDGVHVAVQDDDQTGAIALLDCRGVPDRLLRGHDRRHDAQHDAANQPELRHELTLAALREALQQRAGLPEPRPLATLKVSRHGRLLGEDALGPLARLGRTLLRGQERGVVEVGLRQRGQLGGC